MSTTRPRIYLIAAMTDEHVIGYHNQLPWHIPEDLRYFKQKTLNHAVVMGRKTFESLKKPLPQRHNIILSRNTQFNSAGCTVISSPRDLLKLDESEYWIIGGGQIYEAFMPYADKLYITRVFTHVTGDAFFPSWSKDEWQITHTDLFTITEQNPYVLHFETWGRTGEPKCLSSF